MTLPGWSGLAAAVRLDVLAVAATVLPAEPACVSNRRCHMVYAFRYAPENRARPAELTAVPGLSAYGMVTTPAGSGELGRRDGIYWSWL